MEREHKKKYKKNDKKKYIDSNNDARSLKS